jgi:hypothetical protein
MVEGYFHSEWITDVSISTKVEKLQVALEVLEQEHVWEHFSSQAIY